MENLLQLLVSFPVVPFTVLLGIVLAYWLFVGVGALGIDALDSDGAFGGGVKAGAEGADGLLESLGLGGVPVTVAISVVAFIGWSTSLLATQLAAPVLGASPLFGWVGGSLILLASLFVAFFAGGRSLGPLRRIFVSADAPDRRSAILGRVCTISSGKVDGRFGQATMSDGGAGLILNVSCDRPNQLAKGDRALVLGYDAARDTYEIEPVEWLLPEEVAQLDDPARARAVAASHAIASSKRS